MRTFVSKLFSFTRYRMIIYNVDKYMTRLRLRQQLIDDRWPRRRAQKGSQGCAGDPASRGVTNLVVESKELLGSEPLARAHLKHAAGPRKRGRGHVPMLSAGLEKELQRCRTGTVDVNRTVHW
jgi:hypothetical protein